MQRVWIVLLLIMIAAPVWAQSQIPGTFRVLPPQTTPSYYAPLLTPPSVSFGSGVSGPVVVNQEPLTLVAPYGVPVDASGMAPEVTVAEAAANSRAQSAQMRGAEHFDFIVATGSTLSPSGEDQSLGELAASLRKGPPPTQRSFTNDDISRMNGASNGNFAMPAGTPPAGQPQTQPAPPQQPPKNQTEMKKQHSPFSAPAVSAEQ
jgi:hypothetical protein